jgi:DNA-binding protein HU-beta
MNKQELINEISKKTGLTKKDSAAALDAFIEAVKASLKKGSDVRLVGFGTFTIRKRKPKKGRNPRTGEEIKIPAKKVPAFRPASELKKLVA